MTTNQAKAPISAHPLFPAVVALWFAVLLGLGCGVLPTVVFERIVTFSGLSAIFPATAPPLGFTARIAFSLIAAIAGAAAGFVLARRLANAQYIERPGPVIARLTPKSNPAQRDTVRRPISVKEELGDTKLDPFDFKEPAPQAMPIPGRRRSLALSEDTALNDFLDAAPLPGSEPEWALPALEEPDQEFSERQIFAAPEPEPVAQSDNFAAPELVEPESPAPFARSLFAGPLGDEGDEPPKLAPPAFAAPEPFVPAQEPVFAPQAFQPAPKPEATRPVLPTDPEADLGKLGMVQLAERLGHSLQQRLDRPRPPAPDFAVRLNGTVLPGISGDEGFQDIPAPGAAIFGQAAFEPTATDAPAIPPALHPLPLDIDAFDEDEDEHSHVASLSLPLAGLSPAAVWDDEDEEEIEDAGESEENYSSLLAIKHPPRMPTEFVRINEPDSEQAEIEPAAVLPGVPDTRSFDAPTQIDTEHNRPNPDETDRALRSALAVLQRMSGTA